MLISLMLPATIVGREYSPPSEEILEGNARKLRDLPTEQVARYLAHPFPIAGSAAAKVLAERGEPVTPLMLKLLKDNVAGLRAGAANVLARLYHHEGETFRKQVSPELEKVLAAVRPLINDPDNRVRRAVIRFVNESRVDNPDTRHILLEVAKTRDIGILGSVQGTLRYQLRDPEFRVDLARQSAETLVAMDSPSPGSFKVIQIVSSAHLELCRPLVPASVRFLDRHCLTLWGMFSNSPSVAAMDICERFCDDPRVREALPIILRVYTRKVGGKNVYWTHLQEGPRRILLRIGPKALPTLRAFLNSERALFRKYAASEAQPVNKWNQLWPGHELRFEELEDVAELIRSLHGQKTAGQAVPLMCRIYLERDWSETERQMIRDRLAALGPAVVPLVRQSLKTLPDEARRRLDSRLTSWKRSGKEKLRPLQREIKPLEEHKERIGALAAELGDIATLVQLLALPEPSAAGVETLCRLYIRRDWAPQRAMIRDTLERWGPGTAPRIRKFITADRPYLDQRMANLDDEEAHCRKTQRFGRGLETSLIRLDLARQDLRTWYDELNDLADVIDCVDQAKLSEQALARLCTIYTRRGWASQNKRILAALKRNGPSAAAAIRKHLTAEKEALAEVVARKLSYLSNTVKSRYKWRYDRAKTLEAHMAQGIRELESVVQ